jgi:HEAT repeat protein
MPREQLLTLSADVDRLLAAGAAAAAGNDNLRARSRTLRDLGRKVPALNSVADAVERVTSAPHDKAPRALLDLLVLLCQAQSALTTAGVVGELQPVPPSGPWRTAASSGQLGTVDAALLRRGPGRFEPVQEAVQQQTTADLRLLEPLLGVLGDPYTELADLVAEQALPAFGPAALPDLLGSYNPRGKRSDARRLTVVTRIDPSRGRELCREALAGGSPPVRVAALLALVRVAPAEAEQAAMTVLGGKHGSSLRGAAALVLGEVRTQYPEAILLLIEAFRGSDWDVQRHAADALEKIGRAAVPDLLPVLRHPDPMMRCRTMWVLGGMGPEAVDAVPTLVEALNDPGEHAPTNAARALGEIGPAARAAVPALTRELKSIDTRLRVVAARSLIWITGKPGPYIPTLIAELSSPSVHACRDAAEALAELGSAARVAVPELIRVLKDRTSNARHFAADALGRIGHNAREVVPLLIPWVNDPQWYLRVWAIRALGYFGPKARAALPALREAAKDRSRSIQKEVSQALIAIQGPDEREVSRAP